MRPELVWLLGLHIAGLVIWCGALLYLPALITAGASRVQDEALGCGPAALNRMIFTAIATPAAMFAIITGSLLFLLDRTLGVWLILKLTAVVGMVICHALYGVLILRHEREPHAPAAVPCILLGTLTTVLIGTVLWLVLAKPF
ncbi:MAG TPA: CopD family protein [Rhodocyclaceae bacterium]|jgi:protoporphyrinogen IX oxidase|nr:CopD family protein [Rhodocyclaceae bacterium]HRQ45413.1 CopD family protein [Rhodocyclaceae bacterium]